MQILPFGWCLCNCAPRIMITIIDKQFEDAKTMAIVLHGVSVDMKKTTSYFKDISDATVFFLIFFF